MWLCILGAPLLAGSLEATHPADFGLSLLLKLFNMLPALKARQLHQLFLGSGEMGSWGCTDPACLGALWPAAVSASSACLEHPVDLMRRSSCSISDACSGSRSEELSTKIQRGQADEVKQN